MYFDESVTFGFGSTDGQILRWGRMPLLSVVAPLEINPQMIMWDPQTYPDVKTLADLGEEGVTVNVFGGPSSTFSEVLVAMGVWNQDQIDPSYDGSPDRFIAEDGAIAQYGWASDSPYLYEHILEAWRKAVAYLTKPSTMRGSGRIRRRWRSDPTISKSWVRASTSLCRSCSSPSLTS